MAYYAFFSLFPLLLALIAGAGFVYADTDAQQQVLDLIAEAIPVSRPLIERNVDQVLGARGPVGLVAMLTLLWSAASFFTALAYNVGLAFPNARPRGFLSRRLIGLAMIVVLFALLIISALSGIAATLLRQWQIPLFGGISIYDSFAWGLVTRALPWALAIVLFLFLYRWVPNTGVGWPAAFWGGLVVASAWEVLKEGFGWYLSSGLVQLELIYGSLATVVALLLWVYLTSVVIIFGAHLVAAIAARREPAPVTDRA
jgi:membrane protein